MAIRLPLGFRHPAERELVEDVVAQQQLVPLLPEDELAGRANARLELLPLALKDELEQLGDGGGILADLLLGRRIEDCEACDTISSSERTGVREGNGPA